MDQMMERLGIDPRQVWQADILWNSEILVRRCRSCSNTKACWEWLDGGAGDRYEFCPNAALLDSFRPANPS